MQVGTVKEIKDNENRVGLTPAGAGELVKLGHVVLVEKNSGAGSDFPDSEYQKAGARICSTAKEVWQKSELIVKVKEPLPTEFELIRPGQIIFTYFHFASNEALLDAMLKHKAASVAYETVGTDTKHPLLAPMSEVAGKMAPLIGAYYLAKFTGGRGLLLSGVSGVEPAHVVILGTGFVGRNAGIIAHALQAKLTFLAYDINLIPDLKKTVSKRRIC